MTHPKLTSENIFLVKIDFMNRTHLEEVEMVNELMKEIEGHKSGEKNGNVISNLLTLWLEHTHAHFARENELMQQTKFPAIDHHTDEHDVALNRMQTVVDAWQQNNDIDLLNDYVFTLWPNWFKAHVSSMDKITAQFAVSTGYREI